MSMKAQIASELCKVIRKLGGDKELLATIGSYGDTLNDDDILILLRDWNARNPAPAKAPLTQH